MSNALMAPRKNKRSEAGKAIAQAIIEQYQPTNAEEMQDALKDIFGPMFESMLQGEMDTHLGYESNDHGYKATNNRRNGYSHKTVKTTCGDIPVDVPRDREASFEPQAIPKHSRDVSGIEDKVLSMYAKGIPSKDYKAYTAQLKKVYGASSLKASSAEFERFKQAWSQYAGDVDVWVRNWHHIEQLFNYGGAVRKVMYTTNAIESVNSSLRKVTKKGTFLSEAAVRKARWSINSSRGCG